jgi:hypothetical protein
MASTHRINKKFDVNSIRRFNHSIHLLDLVVACIDQKKQINIDQSCRYFPFSTASLKRKLKAKEALSHVLDDIEINDSFVFEKKIWIYWDKGINTAPDVVKLSLESWTKLNPDFEVIFLDDNTVQNYFDFKSLFYNLTVDVGVAHKSDFIRTFLLAKFGGVWVDSTTFCWCPLSSWLPYKMKDSGFFVFKQPKRRVDRQIKNWFIASSKGNPIMVEMLNCLIAFNFRRRYRTLRIIHAPEYPASSQLSREGTGFDFLQKLERTGAVPYFYFHYLFNEVVKSSEALSDLWSTVRDTSDHSVSVEGELGNAFVSKQTYGSRYVLSSTYRQRVDKLRSVIDNAAQPNRRYKSMELAMAVSSS